MKKHEPLKEDMIPAPSPEQEKESSATAAPDTNTAPHEVTIAELEKKVLELQDKLLRVQADTDNFRKRLQREKEEHVRFANEGLLQELLPVIDNFELGLQASETATDAKSIALGMQMVKTQLQRFLADCGVQEISALGQTFDPHLHEAISQQESPEHKEGAILSQQRKGYKLRDRLLRPAAVIVAHNPATPPAQTK